MMMTKARLVGLGATLALGVPVAFASAPSTASGAMPLFPPGRTETVNIVEWNSNQLPPVYERSEQLPLTDDEVAKLSAAGFTPGQLVKMIQERRCACDASADGLIRLKQRGVAAEVLSAISLHALAPNRALALVLTLDFTGTAVAASSSTPPSNGLGLPREGFLYVFVDDGAVTRVFSANLADLIGRRFAHESMVDRSDLLLTREVRRVELAGLVPLKTYGQHTVLVVASGRPAITHPSELTDAERARAQRYTLDYPHASLTSLCRLHAAWQRDPVLAYRYTFAGSRFECEWN